MGILPTISFGQNQYVIGSLRQKGERGRTPLSEGKGVSDEEVSKLRGPPNGTAFFRTNEARAQEVNG